MSIVQVAQTMTMEEVEVEKKSGYILKVEVMGFALRLTGS